MNRNRFVTAKIAAFALVLGAAVSTASNAYALPHLGIHHHPANPNDTRIKLTVYNKSDWFRDVKIDGHVYTVLPHESLGIKAPEGTPIYTETTGGVHRRGDLLFSVDRTMNNKTLTLN